MLRFAFVSLMTIACDLDDVFDADTSDSNNAAGRLTSAQLAACIDPDDDDDLDADDCIAGVHVSDDDRWGFDADWLGDGGAFTETFTWSNRDGAADYSISIEPPSAASPVGYAGSTLVEVYDGSGALLDSTELVADPRGREVDYDTFLVGAPGDWTIVIDTVDFEGTGSISLSAADPGDR